MAGVLIVDDDPAMRRMLSLIFAEDGFTVFTAANGVEALNFPLLRAGEMDIVITDVRMPEMNGLELAETLRAQQPSLPVLILTACPEYAEAGSRGALQVMAKPFEIQSLLNSVRRLLATREALSAA